MDDGDAPAYVRIPQVQDLVRICRALNEAGARYLLIGGFAMVSHGLGRTTKDIGFLVDDDPQNVARVKLGLAVLEDGAARELEDDDVRRHAAVRVADEVMVDLLGRACGVSYEEAAATAETLEIDGVPIPVADKRMLIRTKDTVRPSDRADREFLEALLRAETEG